MASRVLALYGDTAVRPPSSRSELVEAMLEAVLVAELKVQART